MNWGSATGVVTPSSQSKADAIWLAVLRLHFKGQPKLAVAWRMVSEGFPFRLVVEQWKHPTCPTCNSYDCRGKHADS
jgi:hypothetical protein